MKAKMNYLKGDVSISVKPDGEIEQQMFDHLLEKIDGRAENIEVVVKQSNGGQIIIREKKEIT